MLLELAQLENTGGDGSGSREFGMSQSQLWEQCRHTSYKRERERERRETRDDRDERLRDEMRWEMRRGNGKAVRAELTYAEACARFLDQSHRSTTPWPTVTAHIAHSDHASGNAPLFKEGIAPEKSEVISTDVAKR